MVLYKDTGLTVQLRGVEVTEQTLRAVGRQPASVCVRDAGYGASLGLPLGLLHLDVLETVGAQLCQRDRALWLRLDVASSPSLWGSLDLAVEPPGWSSPQRMPRKSHISSMAAFLRRHAAGLRCVSMHYPGIGMQYPEVGTLSGTLQLLQALEGSPLSSLDLCPGPIPVAKLGTALGCLTALTHLSVVYCGWRDLPAQLTALRRLQHLEISQGRLGGGSWAPLETLTCITRLNIALCSLRRPPAPLPTLTNLSVLDLSFNSGLADAAPLDWQPLQPLVSLTELGLRFCRLTRLPSQLSCLERLATLDLSRNWPLEEDGWDLLGSLTALTRLDLSECQLRQVSQALAGLRSLASLNLSGNKELGRSDVLGLGLLGAVTSLNVSRCGLTCLPVDLAALIALKELDVSCNHSLAATNSAWQPVWQMDALTRLVGQGCGLLEWPRLPPTCEFVGDLDTETWPYDDL